MRALGHVLCHVAFVHALCLSSRIMVRAGCHAYVMAHFSTHVIKVLLLILYEGASWYLEGAGAVWRLAVCCLRERGSLFLCKSTCLGRLHVML